MAIINTTGGPVHTDADGNPLRVINTSRVVEEDLQSLDDEVLHVIPGHPWVATFEDGRELPLVAWAVMESDRGHGVVVVGTDRGPRVDVSEDVSKQPGFTGYIHKEDS